MNIISPDTIYTEVSLADEAAPIWRIAMTDLEHRTVLAINVTQRDILLLALDFYERHLKEIQDDYPYNAENQLTIDGLIAKRQEIVDLAAKVRQG